MIHAHDRTVAAARPTWTTTLQRHRAGVEHAVIPVLVVIDALMVTAGLMLAYIIRFPLNPGLFYIPPASSVERYLALTVCLVPLWLALFTCYGLYDRETLFSGPAEYGRVVSSCTMSIIVVIGVSFFVQDDILIISRGWLLISWVTVVSCVGGERFMTRRVVSALRSRGTFQRRALIVGTTTEAQMVAAQIAGRSSGMRVQGFVATPATSPTTETRDVVGRLEMLSDLITTYAVDDVILVPSALTHSEILDIVRLLATHPVTLRMSPGLYEILTTGVRVADVNGVPLVTINRVRIVGIDAFLKRGLDCVGAAVGLLFLMPFFLIVALLIRLDSSGPIFHRRVVVGSGARPFGAWKFRTMITNADRVLKENAALYATWQREGKLRNDPRITRIGRILRRTSIDELPQLINVLCGQMSLVGPRMITPEELAQFGTWQHNLLTVKPGMTGLWQVRGRSTLSYADRVTLDMDYIRNYSIWEDIRLLAQTVPAILRGRGAY